MNYNKNITAAFTGHRDYDGCADEQVFAHLQTLYVSGYRCFMTGMAWGFDLAAAEQVIRLKEMYSDVDLVLVEPFDGFRRLFSGVDASRYDKIVAAASQRIYVGDSATRENFFLRNNYLVAYSSRLIAWWNGVKRGGTAYTVKRALREGVVVDNLYCGERDLFSGLL